MDTSRYLDRTYGQPPCWELVADVYATEYASEVGRYAVVTGTIREAAQKFALHIATDPHGFIRLEEPVEGCVVLLGSPLVHAALLTPLLALMLLPVSWPAAVVALTGGIALLGSRLGERDQGRGQRYGHAGAFWFSSGNRPRWRKRSSRIRATPTAASRSAAACTAVTPGTISAAKRVASRKAIRM